MKRALLFLFGCAVGWLLLGLLMGVVVDAKLLQPAFLDGEAWLTYGRLVPAANSLLLYGWTSQAAFAVLLWMLARLGGSTLRHPALLAAAIVLWNVGVLVGTCGILLGQQGPFPGLAFPGGAAALLLIAFILVALCGLFLLLDRTTRPLFVSQWYLLAALLCFPWLYATANLLLVWHPAPGSVQVVIAGWFHGGLFWLWLVPIGVACLYYIIPTTTQRPVFAYPSSVFAFRALVVLGGGTGLGAYLGGPVPAWLVSASLAADMLMLIPVTLIEINLFGTLRAAGWPRQPILSLATFSLTCLGLATIQGATIAITAPITVYTDYAASMETMRLLAFVGMALFAAMYTILPQLTGCEIPAARIRTHALLAVVSITLMFLTESVARGEQVSDFLRCLHFLSSLGFLGATVLLARNLLGLLKR